MDSLNLKKAGKLIDEYNKMKVNARAQLHKKRLYELVVYAKEHSEYYADLYKELPTNFTLNDLPTTSKEELTSDYSRWSTDKDVNLDGIYDHMEKHQGDGVHYLGKYRVVSSSGTDSAPIISLYDDNMAALLSAMHIKRSFARKEHFWQFLKRGGRMANIYTTSGPFFYNVVADIRRHTIPFRKKRSVLMQAQTSTGKLVSALNDFDPAVVAGFPSVLARLADEKKNKKLKINPVFLMADGEELTPEVRNKLEIVFGCDITSSYSSVEGGCIAYECREHHLHLNDDWVIVEPVDFDNNPVKPGETCDHVLITNLMNYTLPVIRYALEDKIVIYDKPCLCGNCSPWIEVKGRSLDQIILSDGAHEVIVPMDDFGEVLADVNEIRRYQIMVFPGNHFSLRLSPAKGFDKTLAYFKAEKVLRDYLKNLGIMGSTITLEKDEPKPDPLSGKYLTVIAM